MPLVLQLTCISELSSVVFNLPRGKINELNAEIVRLRKEVETITDDQSSYLSYEKRSVPLVHGIVCLPNVVYDCCVATDFSKEIWAYLNCHCLCFAVHN